MGSPARSQATTPGGWALKLPPRTSSWFRTRSSLFTLGQAAVRSAVFKTKWVTPPFILFSPRGGSHFYMGICSFEKHCIKKKKTKEWDTRIHINECNWGKSEYNLHDPTVVQDIDIGGTRRRAHGVSVHYFLQLHVNLQLCQNKKFNGRNKLVLTSCSQALWLLVSQDLSAE